MAIFNSYVKLPEGKDFLCDLLVFYRLLLDIWTWHCETTNVVNPRMNYTILTPISTPIFKYLISPFRVSNSARNGGIFHGR
jgi:hypothetical protein